MKPLVRRPDGRVRGEPQHVIAAAVAEFEELAARFCFVLFFGPGTRGTLADPRTALPAARRSQPAIIPETTLSHHGNITPDAET